MTEALASMKETWIHINQMVHFSRIRKSSIPLVNKPWPATAHPWLRSAYPNMALPWFLSCQAVHFWLDHLFRTVKELWTALLSTFWFTVSKLWHSLFIKWCQAPNGRQAFIFPDAWSPERWKYHIHCALTIKSMHSHFGDVYIFFNLSFPCFLQNDDFPNLWRF